MTELSAVSLENPVRTKLIEQLCVVMDLLPETEKSWVLHAHVHVIGGIQMWNSVKDWWFLSGERFMRYAKALTTNYRHCEASFLSAHTRRLRCLQQNLYDEKFIKWNISTEPLTWLTDPGKEVRPLHRLKRTKMKQAQMQPARSCLCRPLL